MIQAKSILSTIWRRSTGQYVYLPLMHRTTKIWQEGVPRNPSEFEIPEGEKADQFFSPLRFNGRRSNETVGCPGVLFADLDGAPEPDIMPSLYWETSPGNKQAIWFLDEPMHDYLEWSTLNRAMTYHTGADKGGWMGSKVLRVPMSTNWKRGGVSGELVYFSGMTYSKDHLRTLLKVEEYDREAAPSEPLPVEGVPLDIPYDVKYWLSTTRTPRDRSVALWDLIMSMKNAGNSKDATYFVLLDTPWSKVWHRPEELWRQICKAYNGY